MNCSTTAPGASVGSALAWGAAVLLVAGATACVVLGEVIGRRLRAARHRDDPPYQRLLEEAVEWDGEGVSGTPTINGTRI